MSASVGKPSMPNNGVGRRGGKPHCGRSATSGRADSCACFWYWRGFSLHYAAHFAPDPGAEMSFHHAHLAAHDARQDGDERSGNQAGYDSVIRGQRRLCRRAVRAVSRPARFRSRGMAGVLCDPQGRRQRHRPCADRRGAETAREALPLAEPVLAGTGGGARGGWQCGQAGRRLTPDPDLHEPWPPGREHRPAGSCRPTGAQGHASSTTSG